MRQWVSRTWVGAAATLLAVLGGLLAPEQAAQAAPATVPTVSVAPASGDEMTVYRGHGSGFRPNSSVKVTVTVDGNPYAGSYTHTHPTDAAGAFSWAWIWTTGDPYGSYTLTFTDPSGRSAGAGLAIVNGAAPTPSPGSDLMIDTASAPDATTMQAWMHGVQRAPYAAIAAYLPVGNPAVDDRHDKTQRNLTPGWVKAVQDGGWHVLPVYVGLQAPAACQPRVGAFHPMSTDPATAQAQGVAAASDAVHAASVLGIAATAPVVYDMEGYRSGCSGAVQAFLVGWTARVHALGRSAGVYGTATSAAKDVAAAAAEDPTYLRPDLFWAATDNRKASTEVTGLPAPGWEIANQFLFGVERTYGAASLTVDESAVADAVWQLPARPSDTSAPIVTMGRAPALVRTARATFAWTGVDAGSGLKSYQLRTRRTRGGHHVGAWSAPTKLGAATRGTVHLKLAAGEQVCAQVRAVDRLGNRSDWTLAACTSRLADDRSAKASGGWHRSHQRKAYAKTLTSARRAHADLRLGHAVAGRLGVVRTGRGPLVVRIGHRTVGTLTGTGTRWVSLPRAGKVTLTTKTSRPVAVDGFVLIPR